jgi:uncharacterized protein YlaN (UPF0358 family)
MSHFAKMAPLSTLVRRHGDGEWYLIDTDIRRILPLVHVNVNNVVVVSVCQDEEVNTKLVGLVLVVFD